MKQRMISIAPTVFELFPDVQIGLIVAWNLNNRERSDELTRLLRDEEMHARTLFSAVNISQHPVIQSWRKAYTRFGGSSSYRSSIEALAKRALKGDVLPEINPLVDCYNLTSLKYMMPVGGEDLQHVIGDVQLACAAGSERFTPLGSDVPEFPCKGEVVWVDESKEVLCRRWNWRESNKTKLTESTKKALLVVEGILPQNELDVKEATCSLGSLVQTYCSAKIELFLLNQHVPSIIIKA